MDNWRDALPEPIRNDPSLAQYKTLEDLARGHIETKSFVGRSIQPPGPNAAPEAKKAFVEKLMQAEPGLVYAPEGDEESAKQLFRRLGRPEKPEEYEFDEDRATAAGLTTKELRSLAVTAGLTKSQAQALAKVMIDANLEAQRTAALESAALDQEWGAAKEERLLAARAAALKMGLHEEDVRELSPRQLRAFYAVARAVGVNQNEFRQEGGKPRLSPQEIDAQMADIRRKPEYWDGFKDPAEHKRLVNEMTRLTDMRGG